MSQHQRAKTSFWSQMPFLFRSYQMVSLIFLFTVFTSCLQRPSSSVCAPGATQLCFCSPEQKGVQECKEDGQAWDKCLCKNQQEPDEDASTKETTEPGKEVIPDSCQENTEVCDGKDNNCNGKIDEVLSKKCGVAVGECKQGTQTCQQGQWSTCQGEVLPNGEECNNKDDDCNGKIDDGLTKCEKVCKQTLTIHINGFRFYEGKWPFEKLLMGKFHFQSMHQATQDQSVYLKDVSILHRGKPLFQENFQSTSPTFTHHGNIGNGEIKQTNGLLCLNTSLLDTKQTYVSDLQIKYKAKFSSGGTKKLSSTLLFAENRSTDPCTGPKAGMYFSLSFNNYKTFVLYCDQVRPSKPATCNPWSLPDPALDAYADYTIKVKGNGFCQQ